MKKALLEHFEKNVERPDISQAPDGAVPAYLLDRDVTTRSKVLSNTLKQKRKEKGGKWAVPLPRVRPVADDEMFKVVKTGKRQRKQWKRMVTKVTYVGDGFTRKPPKYERFIRPMGLRFKKAHVTHPELKTTLAPVLKLPDFDRQFVVTTDASDAAVGAILEQDFGNGLQPVAFASQKAERCRDEVQRLREGTPWHSVGSCPMEALL